MIELFIVRRRSMRNNTYQFYAYTDGSFSYANAVILTADEAADVLARYPDAERVQVA